VGFPSSEDSEKNGNAAGQALLVLDDRDNVATLLRPGRRGEELALASGDTLRLVEDIPSGHKVAIRPIGKGEFVVKYGTAIGRATCDIEVGTHVHVHNVQSLRGKAKGASRGQ